MAVSLIWGVIVLIGICVAIWGLVRTFTGEDRYAPPHDGTNAWMQPTSEVIVDPVTGRRQRVWYDPRTGVREYRDDS